MPSVAVKVKWLKNKYDVEIDLDEPAELFMMQVQFWEENCVTTRRLACGVCATVSAKSQTAHALMLDFHPHKSAESAASCNLCACGRASLLLTDR